MLVTMKTIAPIDSTQQAQVLTQTHYYIEQASEHFSRNIQVIPIQFDLIGRAAGMYKVYRRQRQIRYNPYLFAKYFPDNLENTVPHEVAHYVADILYGMRNIRPHGKEWQAIMHLFGVTPAVRCHYDLDGIPQRQHRRFSYRCHCRIHALTTRRHRLISTGQRRYQCRQCQSTLTYMEEPTHLLV